MMLDEAAFSDIGNPDSYQKIYDAAYHSPDIRPAWIGAHRPRTSVDSLRGLANWASTHYDYYLNFVRDYMEKRGDTLDIGCGAGQSTAMLARYSSSAIGIDADAAVIAFANKWNAGNHTTFIIGSFPDQVSGSYDHIFCIETIEHVPYDKQDAFIDAAMAMLRPGGLMFITTPREDEPSPPHIGVWSPTIVDALTKRLGDRIVRQGYFNNQSPVGFGDAPSTHHAWVLR